MGLSDSSSIRDWPQIGYKALTSLLSHQANSAWQLSQTWQGTSIACPPNLSMATLSPPVVR